MVNEEKEKEKRQFNLILHDIKESDDTDSSKQKEEDACAAISIFKDYLDVTVSITKCFYIGKNHDDPNKPHLLKITVGSLDEKVSVFRNNFLTHHKLIVIIIIIWLEYTILFPLVQNPSTRPSPFIS